MNIQNAPAKRIEKFAGQHAHVTCQTNQIDATRLQSLNNFAIVIFATSPAPLDDNSFNSARFCFRQTGGVQLIANDDRNLCVWDSAAAHRIRQRDHIRAATGNKDSEAMVRHKKCSTISRTPPKIPYAK